MLKYAVFIALLGLAGAACAQSPSAPLPGYGLVQHDFMYAGESHNRRIYIMHPEFREFGAGAPDWPGKTPDCLQLSA